MSLPMRGKILNFRAFLPFLLAGILPVQAAEPTAPRRNWPFDQRQILLAKDEAQTFPDEIAVAQMMDIFVRRGRVRWTTMKGGTGQIVPIEIPRDFQWQSNASVRELGLKYKVDGIMVLQTQGVVVDLRWYATVDGAPLFFESVSLPTAETKADIVARKKRLIDWVEDIWNRIPGQGYVVKRDFSTLNLEGAKQSGLKVGQVVELRRLHEMKRHPLLKTLVTIDSTVTGRAKLTTVAEPFSTAKIEYESQTDPIQEGDRYAMGGDKKVTAVTNGEATESHEVKTDEPKESKDEQGRTYIPMFNEKDGAAATDKKAEDDPGPKYHVLDLTGGFSFGKLSYEESAGGKDYKMSAYLPGFQVDAKAFLTREWLILAGFRAAFGNFRGLPGDYGSGSSSVNTSNADFRGAYRFIFMDEGKLNGEFLVSLGYRRYAFTLSQVSVAALAPSSKAYSGFDFGFGVQVPFTEAMAFRATASRSFAASLSENPGSSGSVSGSSLWEFGLFVKTQLNRSSNLDLGLRLTSASSSFQGSGARATPARSSQIRATDLVAGYTRKF